MAKMRKERIRRPNANSPAVAASHERKETPNGILSLATDLFSLRTSCGQSMKISARLIRSARLPKTCARQWWHRSTILPRRATMSPASRTHRTPRCWRNKRKDLDALTAQFKQVSASLLPLGKQSILLDMYKRSGTNWRNAVHSQYQAEMKGLLLRLLGLGLILGSGAWHF